MAGYSQAFDDSGVCEYTEASKYEQKPYFL